MLTLRNFTPEQNSAALALSKGEAVAPDMLAVLQARGLVDQAGALTADGTHIAGQEANRLKWVANNAAYMAAREQRLQEREAQRQQMYADIRRELDGEAKA